MRKVKTAVLIGLVGLFSVGCRVIPSIEVGIDIPATVYLRTRGIEVEPEDYDLPPVRHYYHKVWYEQDLVLEYTKSPDGTLSITFKSLTEVDAALEREKARDGLLLEVIKAGTAIGASQAIP